MPDDFDHEVIDSPAALLQHLYEAHGVEEALGLDPDTAPLQFWLRRHAELERASHRDPTRPGSEPSPPPAPQARSGGEQRPPAPQGRPGPPPPGPRYRPFADPLVEAVVAALIRRGLEERRVRRWVASYSSPDGRQAGENAIRAGFLAPVLDALEAQVRGVNARASQAAAPPTTPPPETPPHGERPAPAAAAAPAPDPNADFMAIADVLQSRRRRGGRGRREAAAAPAAPAPAAARAPAGDHDDYMALADAVQQPRRRSRR